MKSGDFSVTVNILANEVSDLVVYNTQELVKSLNKIGINAQEKWSDEEIVDVILENLNKNNNLANALAFLISDYNKIINQKGDTEKKSLKIVNDIADGIRKLATQMQSDKSILVEMRKMIMDQIVSKSSANNDYKRQVWKSKSRKKLWIALGVIGVGVGIACIIYYNRNKTALAVDGGSLAPSIDPLKTDASAINSMSMSNPTITTPPIPPANPIVSTQVQPSI